MRPLLASVCMTILASVMLAVAPEPSARAVPGQPAPPVHATRLDGTRVDGFTPGTVTVLNFWATWCPPCRAETPDLVAAYQRLHARDVAFLGIDTTETAPIVTTFLGAKGVPYPTALAPHDAYTAYGVIGIPTTVVVDGHGIVRARWVGGVTAPQLAHYVADARAGRSSVYVSPAQRRVDAMLAPGRFAFTDPARRAADVRAMSAAIDRAERMADDDALRVDDERTEHEAGVLRVEAGSALLAAARTTAQRVRGESLLAKGDGNLGRWDDAANAYRAAVALAPDDTDLRTDYVYAQYRRNDYPAMIEAARGYTQRKPRDGDGWSLLGLANVRARRPHDAVAPYERSIALLRAAATAHPTQDAIADVADTSLDLADVYVSLGDGDGARRTFAVAQTYGAQLTPNGTYKRLKRNVTERTQEGLVALALATNAGHPVISIAPWTGPDLPGSVASTLKYRLIVAARANATVTLRATHLRPDWIASFCTDGLCSPQRVAFVAPPGGVKTYEFQLVPPTPDAQPGPVGVDVTGGAPVTVPPLNAARR